MAEEGWRVNARGRRVPSRVTSNMSEFVTKGKLTEDERRREGRRTKTGRKATPRDAWGDKRPVTKSTGGKDSARRKRVETVRKYNKRAWGGVNPKVTSSGDVGARSIKDRRAKLPDGGQRYKPITESDGPRGGGSKYQSRTQRVKRSYAAGTEGSRKITTSDDFYPRDKRKVTKGKGGYAGYRYVKPGTNEPIRKVDPPDTKRGQRRSGQGRTNTTSPNAQKANQRTGRSPMRGPGKPGSANDTGARRTGGGRKGQISSKGGPQKSGYTPKMNQKGRVKANTVLKGIASLLSRRFSVAMTGYDIVMLGKRDSVLSKALLKLPKTDPKTDAGKILGDKIVALATTAYNKVKGKVKGSKTKTDTPPPKKETKPKRQTKRLVKK